VANSENSAQSAHRKRTQPSNKVFDVMRPGRAPVQATSRPVIVGHKPEVNDPMMNRTMHVVGDAANALQVPDEPLLMAHNPDAMNSNLPPVPPAPVSDMAANDSHAAQADTETSKVAPKPADVAMPATPVPLQHFKPVEPTVPELVSASPTAAAPGAITPPPANVPSADGQLTDVSASGQPAMPAANPTQQISAEPRNTGLDDQAKDDLAALAVEGITEIEDGHQAQPAQPETANANSNTQLLPNDETPSPVAVTGASRPQPPTAQPLQTGSAPPISQKPLPHLEPDDDVNGYPTASEMGHFPNAQSSAVVASGKARKSNLWAWILAIVLLLVIAAVVVDVLLDGGFITIQHVPHTHFF